ncbi:hypothetical protein E2C01_025511 [Portunus trituberculatus]|uniref:Uncharacterized protein n=1 Tax=Portunus trituberculatus TaxID=210409 RepID=A0A5B7EFQ8_PORTR|nr:hypothetical protein [Portunus trituberculatus]
MATQRKRQCRAWAIAETCCRQFRLDALGSKYVHTTGEMLPGASAGRTKATSASRLQMKLSAFIKDASLGADMFVYIAASGNTRPTRSASCEKRSQSQAETQNAIGNTFRQYCLPIIAKFCDNFCYANDVGRYRTMSNDVEIDACSKRAMTPCIHLMVQGRAQKETLEVFI